MITKGHIDWAIEQATIGYPPDMPIVKGLSSNRVRRLLNVICCQGTNYLEIGVSRGSTFIPAVWNNPHLKATCVDMWTAHWALEGAQRADLEANLKIHLPDHAVNIVEGNMFTIDLNLLIPEVDVFFYDGPHSRDGQYQAFIRYNPVFAPRFVALVDDYNNIEAKEETTRAFQDLNYKVEHQWELPGTPPRDEKRWWNGLYVAMVSKQ